MSVTAQPRHALLPEQGFVRLPQILNVLPIGKSTWWAGVRSGRFPRPTKLGARISVWKASEIRALLATIAEDGTA